MPTKPEQSDLDMAVHGRHGESPVAVLAPATGEDCFHVMIDAARLAIAAMTPAIVLSDAFLANAVSEWVPPDISALEPVLTRDAATPGRDPDTLIRAWVAPGTPERETRVGGLEKDRASGNISYDPGNHEAMVALRAEKLARAAGVVGRPTLHDGPEDGDLLVVGWGSTFGAIRQASRNLRGRGHPIAHLHIRQLWPLPHGLGDIFKRYRRIACAELNTGQLTRILRAETLCDVRPVSQINGRPFRIDTLEAALGGIIGDAS
jgi:2-oxoglutarate ferredoxin oxidoreductase subunit alpha